jgi:hypothetical protein
MGDTSLHGTLLIPFYSGQGLRQRRHSADRPVWNFYTGARMNRLRHVFMTIGAALLVLTPHGAIRLR